MGLAFDASGNLYVADSGNHRIRKISPVGTVTTFAGSGNATFANGNATSAGFNRPLGLSTDSSGNVYVADFHNHRIRKITPSGIVSTLAGANTLSATGGNAGVFADGIGENARFYNPTGVVATSNGTIYVTDFGFNKVRKITPGALVTTYAGSGEKSYEDGFGPSAEFSGLWGIALGQNGSVYVSEVGNHRIRKISPSTNQPPPPPPPTYTVTLTRGGNASGYGVTNNISPNGTTLSFTPLNNRGALPVFGYVVIPGDTSVVSWGLVGSITITSGYGNTAVMFKVVRNGKTYLFSSNSYQNKPRDFFSVGSGAGNYYILDDSTLQSP
jgi:streptogramin lyase